MSTAIPQPRKHLYEFGPFRLDPAERILARGDERIFLAPKAFETLLVLVRQRGHVLSKDELIQTIWPDSFVEENNLTQNISALRKALGEASGEQEYIETVPRLGYRFVALVREVTAGTDPLASSLDADRDRGSPINPTGTQGEGLTEKLAPLSAGSSALRFPWLKFLIGLCGVAAVMVSVFLYLSRPKRAVTSPASGIEGRESVAVLGFRNLSNDPADDWLSTAFAEMLTTELAAGERLRTVSGEDIARVKRDLRLFETDGLSSSTLAKVRNSLGADITISGSYMKLGEGPQGKIRLDLQLQDTARGETVGSVAQVGTIAELFELVSRSGAELRAKLGTPSPGGAEEGQFRAALPASLEAARLYSQGLSKLRAFDAPAAQVLLGKAVAADPKYALGHSALSSAWSALGYDQEAETETKRALDLSENLSREERLLISGRYSEITHSWDKAVDTYKLLVSFFPDNLDFGLRLASAQTSAGKGNDALATIEKLRRLRPPQSEDPQIDLAEASAAESLGDFKRERETSETAAHKGEVLGEELLTARARFKQGWALSRMGEPQQALGTLDNARSLFEAAGDKQGAASTLRVMANVFFNQGDYSKGIQTGRLALSVFTKIGDRRGMAQSLNTIAIIYLEKGEFETAKGHFEQSLAIQREVASKINIAGALGNIAEVLDAEGQLAEAQKLTDESIKVFVEVGDKRALATALENRADLLLERGELASAKEAYEQALKTATAIGYQRGVAFDLSGLSRVLATEGDSPAAYKQEGQAHEIRKSIGEKHNAAVSLAHLAELTLEQGNPTEAVTFTSQALGQFRTDKSAKDEALAQAQLARSFAKQGELSQAKAAIREARSLSKSSASRSLRFEIALVNALVETTEQAHPTASSVANVKKELEDARQEAKSLGYIGYEFELRLVLGEIEIAHGNPARGNALLEELSAEATRKQFLSVARRASAALGNARAR